MAYMQKKQPAIKNKRDCFVKRKKKRKETKNTMFGTGKVLDKEGGGNVLIKPIKVCISMCIPFGGS